MKDTVAQIVKDFGRIDILVNNAGITRDGLIMQLSDDNFNDVINTNLRGSFNMIRAVSRTMLRQKSGRICNISSVSGLMGNAGQTNYSASKAAVEGFTKTLAKECARKNITVNAIEPAHIDTDMQRSVPADILERSIKSNPSQRLGTTDELAAVAFFLAKDDSSFVNGVVIPVCGGLRT